MANEHTSATKVEENENATLNNAVQKKSRSSEVFYDFCTIVLNYENYEENERPNGQYSNKNSTVPPIEKNINSENENTENKESQENDTDIKQRTEDDNDLITCYCGKPYSGRAMIECLKCLTWIHLSCAKIRKNNIPQVFLCIMCKKEERPSSADSLASPGAKRTRKSL